MRFAKNQLEDFNRFKHFLRWSWNYLKTLFCYSGKCKTTPTNAFTLLKSTAKKFWKKVGLSHAWMYLTLALISQRSNRDSLLRFSRTIYYTIVIHTLFLGNMIQPSFHSWNIGRYFYTPFSTITQHITIRVLRMRCFVIAV